MIVIHAVFPIADGKIDEARDLASELVEASNEEAGLIEYRAAVDIEDETVLRFFEEYEDEAAFESHLGTDHFNAFDERLPDLLAGEPTVRRFEVSEATDLEL